MPLFIKVYNEGLSLSTHRGTNEEKYIWVEPEAEFHLVSEGCEACRKAGYRLKQH